jgi:hypothetical protein
MAPSRPPKRCCRRLKRRTRRLKRRSRSAEATDPSAEATKSLHPRVKCIPVDRVVSVDAGFVLVHPPHRRVPRLTQARSAPTGAERAWVGRGTRHTVQYGMVPLQAGQSGGGPFSQCGRFSHPAPGLVGERRPRGSAIAAVGHRLKSPGNPPPLEPRGRPPHRQSPPTVPGESRAPGGSSNWLGTS